MNRFNENAKLNRSQNDECTKTPNEIAAKFSFAVTSIINGQLQALGHLLLRLSGRSYGPELPVQKCFIIIKFDWFL